MRTHTPVDGEQVSFTLHARWHHVKLFAGLFVSVRPTRDAVTGAVVLEL